MPVTYDTIPCGCIIRARRSVPFSRFGGGGTSQVRTDLKYINICAIHKTQLNDEAKADVITRLDTLKTDIQNSTMPEEPQ